ncbi:MAG TPA: hypothetical protein VGG48_05525 [Rhizomicrobium sp.]|jgi:hypothetical protein
MSAKLLFAALLFAAQPALADDCDAVKSSVIKLISRPYHDTYSVTIGGRVAMSGQHVSIGGKRYGQCDGCTNPGWRLMNWDQDKDAAKVRDAVATQPMICRKSGVEAVDGDLADIFDTDTLEGGKHYQNRVWVSRASGLRLKVSSTFDHGETALRTFQYRDIHAPDIW